MISIGPSLTILRIIDIEFGTNILPEAGLALPLLGLLFYLYATHSAFMAGVRVINGIVFSSMFSDVVEDTQVLNAYPLYVPKDPSQLVGVMSDEL